MFRTGYVCGRCIGFTGFKIRVYGFAVGGV